MTIKKAAVLNDLSGFGKCSLVASLSVLPLLGVQCIPLATAVLTGQTGYPHYACTDLTDMMPAYIENWKKNNVSFDAIYSGYLTGHQQISHVQTFIKCFRTPDCFLLVDPVMGDDGKTYDMFSEDLRKGMQQISRQANLITPNLTEACLLADMSMEEIHELLNETAKDTDTFLSTCIGIGKKLQTLATYPQEIVITGIKPTSAPQKVYNLALCAAKTKLIDSPLLGKSYSGTGDLFASLMCGLRLRGLSTIDSMEIANQFLQECLADTITTDTPSTDGICYEPHLGKLLCAVKNR